MKRWPLALGVEPVYQDAESMVICGDAFTVPVPQIDTLICDCPYSAKTHKGHDRAIKVTSLGKRGDVYHGGESKRTATMGRRRLNYPPWSPDDVRRFVDLWAPRTRGWFVSVTDSELAPHWANALEAHRRCVFAPLPFVEFGSRVRLAGDGPSSITCWIIVARPRHRPYSNWGTLPGAYVVPEGMSKQRPGADRVVGDKPAWLGDQLVRHYSREGDVVCDPCAGNGTFGISAKRWRRRALLIERDERAAQGAAKELAATRPLTQIEMRLDVQEMAGEQVPMAMEAE